MTECLKYIQKYNRTHTEKIAFLLCTEISRITRPDFIDEGLAIIKAFRVKGLTVYDVFERQYYERSDDMNMLRLFLSLIKAKEERIQGLKRCLNGKRQRMRMGYWVFPAPAGYQNVR